MDAVYIITTHREILLISLFVPPGAGNSVFPLLSENANPDLAIHAYDYSSHAVKLVHVSTQILRTTLSADRLSLQQNNPLYLSPPCGAIHSSVWDLSSPSLPDDLGPEAADIVVLVFVLSALHPDEWPQAVSNIFRVCRLETILRAHLRRRPYNLIFT